MPADPTPPETADPEAAPPPGAAAAAPPKRQRRVLVGAIFALATVIGLVAVFAVWTNRQALNTDNWTETSSELLADEKVQAAVSAYLVAELFSSVDVSSEIATVLPDPAKALAGPAAAGLRQLADRAAPQVIASPAVQEEWRKANRITHQQLLKLIDGGGEVLATTDGEVVLNLRALITQLAASLGLSGQLAEARSKVAGLSPQQREMARALAQQKLGLSLPPATGKITIMKSDQLALVQDGAKAIKSLAVILTILALGLFALGVGLAGGWRRAALRTTGWCFVAIGLVVVLGRRFLGNQVVDGLVASPSNIPAADNAWDIATSLLYDIGSAMVVYGIVLVAAAWLAGSTRPARGLRRALAPTMRDRPAIAWAVAGVAFLLVLLWGPTPATTKLAGILLLAVLLALGVEAYRRQIRSEFPDVPPGATVDRVRAWAGRSRDRATGAVASARGGGGEPAAAGPAPDRIAQLERLSTLHDTGKLSDSEFEREKKLLSTV